MSRKRRGSYDVGYMRIVVGLIRDGIGAGSLARRLGVSGETTREWSLSYRIGGEAALMGERGGNGKYDYETKLAAVLDHPERGMSGPEAMECHGIASRHPDMAQQQRLLAMLEEKLPEGADPILHSDMGWQYQHDWWRNRLGELNIRQSMSRKGNCIDNAATEQVFGHLKDEFYRGREFASYEEFEAGLDAYMAHWNTRRRQIRLEGHTSEEFRNMSLTA